MSTQAQKAEMLCCSHFNNTQKNVQNLGSVIFFLNMSIKQNVVINNNKVLPSVTVANAKWHSHFGSWSGSL
jgi:hypothetical protein